MTKEELIQKRISAISLGCDKNRVDLEKMLFKLKEYGFEIISSIEEANIVLINTCAFIEPARQEAIDNIIEVEALKKMGRVEKILVTGCLPSRHSKQILEAFPLVDAAIDFHKNDEITNIIENLYSVENSKCVASYDRVLTTSSSYAYLKIADGCNNVCAYCTIPRIRGPYKSENMQDIVAEAKLLAKKGVKELIVVAQDTTRYGIDLYGKPQLVELLKKLASIKDIKWIRLHYAYPEMISAELLNFIDNEPKMCNYIDIPLQHIDDNVLSLMRRKHNEKFSRDLVKEIKVYHPDIKIRSTFIVGHPGETRKAFGKLLKFLKSAKLDYVGFFPYSREEGTVSYYLKGQKSRLTKLFRLKKAQKLQAKIAFELASKQIGDTIEVLVDEYDENDGTYVGHCKFLSPSVDFGVKIVDNNIVHIGEFVMVKLNDFDGNFYKGEIV